jgi:hypothetical protein
MDKLPICDINCFNYGSFLGQRIELRICVICRRAYEAGIAAEKQRQNSYVEQAYERPDEGAMVE